MEWYKSKEGWITSALAVAAFVLNRWGQLDAAKEIYRTLKNHWPRWSSISPFIAPGLFVLAVIFFELERRKRLRTKPYDLNTLKGRTLKLHDDLQAFADGIGPFVLGPTDSTLQGVEKSLLHSDRFIHGYDLRFAADVRKIYNEFGERGIHDAELNGAIDKPITGERCLMVIASLSRLAAQAEVEVEKLHEPDAG